MAAKSVTKMATPKLLPSPMPTLAPVVRSDEPGVPVEAEIMVEAVAGGNEGVAAIL